MAQNVCIPRTGEYLGWTAASIESYWIFQFIEGFNMEMGPFQS